MTTALIGPATCQINSDIVPLWVSCKSLRLEIHNSYTNRKEVWDQGTCKIPNGTLGVPIPLTPGKSRSCKCWILDLLLKENKGQKIFELALLILPTRDI